MFAMSFINGSRDRPNQDISELLCGMNVTSTTAVGYSVATSSPESSSLNDCEKPNQPKKLLLPKYVYG